MDNLMTPLICELDLAKGSLVEADRRIVRNASSMRGHYADESALEKLIAEQHDPLHYEVFENTIPEQNGHLMYCISKLQPGTVGGEYFMTKGHYHSVSGTAEIYLCLEGEGYMLMKTSQGDFAAEPMSRGRIIYVPPHWAHRSVNTGSVPLISFCVYPAEAGHNYGDIENEGFPKRVVNRDGRAVII